LNNPPLLLSNFVMADAAVAEFCRGARIDTDDHPVIEFAAPKLPVRSSRQGMLNLLEFGGLMTNVSLQVTNLGTMPSALLQTELERYRTGKRAILEGLRFELNDNPDARLRAYEQALARDPTNEELIFAVRELRESP
jgi:hypothetical protein